MAKSRFGLPAQESDAPKHPLDMMRKSDNDADDQPKGKAQYPPDHQPGMQVPNGGSMCANCKYLKDPDAGLCGNEYFVAWNGSDKIPEDINQYCSDWYEPAEGTLEEGMNGSAKHP